MLPDALASHIEAALGEPLVAAAFCGHPHAESNVWRLELASGRRCVLKQHRRPRKLAQELAAYRLWAASLADTPSLLAVLEPHGGMAGALLLEHLPGQVVTDLDLQPHQHRTLHRRAGAWLRTLHALPCNDTDPLPLATAIVARARAAAERAQGLVDASLIEAVRTRVGDGTLFAGLRRVPCHRDFTPRNWLATPGGEWRAVIDFEHALPDLWLTDLARLEAEVWPHDETLRTAFLEGYGAALDAADDARLAALVGLHGLATVGWAVAHGDAEFEASGRAVLARLAAGTC